MATKTRVAPPRIGAARLVRGTLLTARLSIVLSVVAVSLVPLAVGTADARTGMRATTQGLASHIAPVSGRPVQAAHPRLLLTQQSKALLRGRVAAGDPAWLALKAEADTLASYAILPYTYARRTDEVERTIFYDYQGEGWYTAAMPLAVAYQMTGDRRYVNKLLALADEIVRAQSDPANQPPRGYPPLQPGNYYPTRSLGPTVAIIYDWCYDALGTARRARLVRLMNAYFDDLRKNAYQANDHADGNYFMGHLIAAAYMGYASFGDNPRAGEMIDFARVRLDGTAQMAIPSANRPLQTVAQFFDGGAKPAVATDYNGPAISGAPFKSGFDFQGWAYGTGTFSRLIDYLLTVRSATGEDLVATHRAWFVAMLRAEKHALLPDRFRIDPTGDWGSDWGAAILQGLPLRLAYVLAGTPYGPGAQHFLTAEIAATSPDPAVPNWAFEAVYRPAAWETFFFGDARRPSAPLAEPLYYGAFGPAYPRAVATATNGAIPYFLMRSNWGKDATWISTHMGAAFYDDHQHADAGTLLIAHGPDFLVVDASNWKGKAGSSGIVGSSFDETAGPSSAANTVWFDDFGTFQRSPQEQLYSGGQAFWGEDQVVADEQNDAGTYVRSDLTSAYNRSADPQDQVGRKLAHFYRTFAYVRAIDTVVVYDQVLVQPSASRYGPYLMHLRWHFPDRPMITGRSVRVDQGAARLYLDTLLPRAADLRAVDESHNQDPCNGVVTPCTSYGDQAQSGTWRLEVRDSAHELQVPFLTVLQPGSKSRPHLVSTLITSTDGSLVGVRLAGTGGTATAVLFNNAPGQVPAPLTTASYPFQGPPGAMQIIGGALPGASYTFSWSGGEVRVARDPAGRVVASAAGILRFRLPAPR